MPLYKQGCVYRKICNSILFVLVGDVGMVFVTCGGVVTELLYTFLACLLRVACVRGLRDENSRDLLQRVWHKHVPGLRGLCA